MEPTDNFGGRPIGVHDKSYMLLTHKTKLIVAGLVRYFVTWKTKDTIIARGRGAPEPPHLGGLCSPDLQHLGGCARKPLQPGGLRPSDPPLGRTDGRATADAFELIKHDNFWHL